ncbi:hypothetical protein [Streptomyces sp. NPDC058374]|uniref:hypothetical protein n=1 Tax=Streptomyces sp. NPDC058374 TaxID=3346466 RepID=UPI00364C9483
MIVALGAAVFVRGMVKGTVQRTREGTRRDLMALAPSQRNTETLARRGAATYAFAPPLSARRSHPWGWLWWSTHYGLDGTPRHERGWALTYRQARKAARLPIDARSNGIEYLMSPDPASVAAQPSAPADAL